MREGRRCGERKVKGGGMGRGGGYSTYRNSERPE